jgi:hypothetical protein
VTVLSSLSTLQRSSTSINQIKKEKQSDDEQSDEPDSFRSINQSSLDEQSDEPDPSRSVNQPSPQANRSVN